MTPISQGLLARMRSRHDIPQAGEVIRTCFSGLAAARLPAICAPCLVLPGTNTVTFPHPFVVRLV